MGKNHCRVLNAIKNVDFIGVYDIDRTICEETACLYGVLPLSSYSELLSYVDAVIIAVPTSFHFTYVEEAMSKGKHVFVEKPFVSSLYEANKLMKLKKENPYTLLQVGHIERFNPVIQKLDSILDDSKIISMEARRLSKTERNLDIDVVLDLMIHDIDIIISMKKTSLYSIKAVGTYSNIQKNNLDIAHALLTFQDGTIANLIANRVSYKSLRTLSITKKDCVIDADYLSKELKIYRKLDSPFLNTVEHTIDKIKIPPDEPLQSEINHFIDSIIKFEPPLVGANEATKALSAAIKIKESIFSGKTLYLPD